MESKPEIGFGKGVKRIEDKNIAEEVAHAGKHHRDRAVEMNREDGSKPGNTSFRAADEEGKGAEAESFVLRRKALEKFLEDKNNASIVNEIRQRVFFKPGKYDSLGGVDVFVEETETAKKVLEIFRKYLLKSGEGPYRGADHYVRSYRNSDKGDTAFFINSRFYLGEVVEQLGLIPEGKELESTQSLYELGVELSFSSSFSSGSDKEKNKQNLRIMYASLQEAKKDAEKLKDELASIGVQVYINPFNLEYYSETLEELEHRKRKEGWI